MADGPRARGRRAGEAGPARAAPASRHPRTVESSRDVSVIALEMLNEAIQIETLLEAADLPHAACGALAMALHGMPRASVDVDFVVVPAAVDAVRVALREIGFTHEPGVISVARGRIEMHRFVRIPTNPDSDARIVDFLLAKPGTICEKVLAGQERRSLPTGQSFRVLSIIGLIELKSISERDEDRADVKRMQGRLRYEQEQG